LGFFPATRNVLPYLALSFLLRCTELVCLRRALFFSLLFSLLRPNVLSDFAVRDAIAGVLYGGTNVSHVEWFEASFDHYGLSFSFHFSPSMLIFDLETEWGLGVDILALTMAFFFG
jgi:hypothetical protein